MLLIFRAFFFFCELRVFTSLMSFLLSWLSLCSQFERTLSHVLRIFFFLVCQLSFNINNFELVEVLHFYKIKFIFIQIFPPGVYVMFRNAFPI